MSSNGKNLDTIKLGAGPAVFPLALGCMGLTGGIYGAVDERESMKTIHAALERGVTLLDTGDFYSMGANELLVARALRERPDLREKALLSVKFGGMRSPDGAFVGFDGRPAAVKNFVSYSLVRLGVDHIDIYRPARLDTTVPIEDTIGAIADLVKAGYVRSIGLSEVGPETVRRAHAVHPIADLQIEYSLMSRGPEEKIFPVLAELGIGVTAYGVLSRGLLSGSKVQSKGDYRAVLPRFTGENGEKNRQLVAALEQLAAERGATTGQLAIAWVLAKGKGRGIVPTIGSRTVAQLEEALGALELDLSNDDLARIERAVPADAVAGTRYGAEQMHHLDSER